MADRAESELGTPPGSPPQFIRPAQMFEQFGVGGGETEFSKFFAAHPTHSGAINRLWFVRKPAAAEEF